MVENFNLTGVAAKRNCDTVHGDFLKLDNDDPRLTRCTMALVDPSCSGGGDFSHTVSESITTASSKLDKIRFFMFSFSFWIIIFLL